MNLRAFLDAGYALFVREFQRTGKHLLDAIEMTNEAFGFPKSEDVEEAKVEAQNEASLLELNRKMAALR